MGQAEARVGGREPSISRPLIGSRGGPGVGSGTLGYECYVWWVGQLLGVQLPDCGVPVGLCCLAWVCFFRPLPVLPLLFPGGYALLCGLAAWCPFRAGSPCREVVLQAELPAGLPLLGYLPLAMPDEWGKES